MDIKLTGNDITFVDGELEQVFDADAVAQHVQMRLQTWLEESAYDLSQGMPWLQGVLGRKPLDGVAFLIDQQIRETPGVTDLKDFTLDLENETRLVTVAGIIVVVDEEIDFTVEVSQ